jgi:hypothetical protein
MNVMGPTDLDQLIDTLSLEEQLRLLERLAARVRQTVQGQRSSSEDDLAAMAADPDIQRELRMIEEEFRGTELDGLEQSS